jgi:hypothetical protein
MLKNNRILIVYLALLVISACTKLNDADRQLLMNTRIAAEEAREQALISAYSAEIASEKAERIFKQSQKK